VDEVYPPGAVGVTVHPGPLATCSRRVRPGHFAGVLTVVAKLFGLVRPDLAVFGEKDYQQLTLIRAMARELALGVEVVGVPTSRGTTPGALRARTLPRPGRRVRAATLYRALRAGADAGPAGRADARHLPAAGCGAGDRADLVPGPPVAHQPRHGTSARGRTRPPAAGRPPSAAPDSSTTPRSIWETPMMRTMLKSKIHRATVTQAEPALRGAR
jgi:hypothetical protein